MRAIGLSSAFRTLTIIPCVQRDPKNEATMLYWFWLVGFVIGLIGYGIMAVAISIEAIWLGSVATVVAWAWITRAFHLDGLADMFDGFGGGWNALQRLAIMKDSSIGSFGAVALISVILLKMAAIIQFDTVKTLPLLVSIPIFSRYCLVLQTVANPYARKEGGTAARLVTQARWYHAAVVSIVITGCTWYLVTRYGWPVIGIVSVGLLTTLAVALKSRKHIGGITGDVLGATVELSECAMLIASAVVIRML